LNVDKIFQVRRRWKLRRRNNNNSQIGHKENLGLLDQCLENKDREGEENRSQPLYLSAERQQPLDLVVRRNLDC
jgi:hypothetical protein